MASLSDNTCVVQRDDIKDLENGTVKSNFGVLHNNIGYYKIDKKTKVKSLIGMIMVREKMVNPDPSICLRHIRYRDDKTSIYPEVNGYQHSTLVQRHVQNFNISNDCYQCIKPVDKEIELVFVNPSFYHNISVFMLNSTNQWEFNWADASIDGKRMSVETCLVNPSHYVIVPIGGTDALYDLTEKGLQIGDRYIFFNMKSHEPDDVPVVTKKRNRVFDRHQYVWEPVLDMQMDQLNWNKMKRDNHKALMNSKRKWKKGDKASEEETAKAKVSEDSKSKMDALSRRALTSKLGKGVVIKFDRGTQDYWSVTPDYLDEQVIPTLRQSQNTTLFKQKEERLKDVKTEYDTSNSIDTAENKYRYKTINFPCGHESPYINSVRKFVETTKPVTAMPCTDAQCAWTNSYVHDHIYGALCVECCAFILGRQVVYDTFVSDAEKKDLIEKRIRQLQSMTGAQVTEDEEKKLVTVDSVHESSDDVEEKEIGYDDWIAKQTLYDLHGRNMILARGQKVKSWEVQADRVTTDVYRITHEDAPTWVKPKEFVFKIKVNKVITTNKNVTQSQFDECLKNKNFSSIVISNADLVTFNRVAYDQMEFAMSLKKQYVDDYLDVAGFAKIDKHAIYLPIYEHTIDDLVKSTTNALLLSEKDLTTMEQSHWTDHTLYSSSGGAKVIKTKEEEEEKKPRKLRIIGISCDFVSILTFVKPDKQNINIHYKPPEENITYDKINLDGLE